MPDYNNGKIYKLYNTITDDIYIGATTRLLRVRLTEHRRARHNIKYQQCKLYIYFNEHGAEHFKIELLENYNCNSKAELATKEGEYIRALSPALNTRIAGRTQRQYTEENHETILIQRRRAYLRNIDRHKRYYKDNKATIDVQTKLYIQRNKERIREYCKNYYKQKKQEKTNTV